MKNKKEESFVEEVPVVKNWEMIDRPGYFGSRKGQIINDLNNLYGKDNWRLVWTLGLLGGNVYSFEESCKAFYENSYYQYFRRNPEDLDYVCSFNECIDNDMSNIGSGTNYLIQESRSTHIQDIAVRNVVKRLGREFSKSSTEILVIRSSDSNGFKFGPGNIPFTNPELITQPSLCPKWAKKGSVEDFWQSNKWIQVAK